MNAKEVALITSNAGSWSFDQRVRGGTPSFLARQSFTRDVYVTHPTLRDWSIFLYIFWAHHQILNQKEIILKHHHIVVICTDTKTSCNETYLR